MTDTTPYVVGRHATAVSARTGNSYTLNDGAAVAAVHVYDERHVVLRFTTTKSSQAKTLPMQLVELEGTLTWIQKGFPGRLYNAATLADPERPVVVVAEGEKVADLLQAELGEHVAVITWAGGTSALNACKALTERPLPPHIKRAYLCPDHDVPGYQAMYSLREHGVSMARGDLEVWYVTCSSGENVPIGWDLADVERKQWRMQRFESKRDDLPESLWESVRTEKWGGQKLQSWAIGLREAQERRELVQRAIEEGPGPTSMVGVDRMVAIPIWPDMNSKGKPRDTYDNLLTLLREQRWMVTYNIIAKSIDVYRIPQEHADKPNWHEYAKRLNGGQVQVEHIYEHIIDAVMHYEMPRERIPKLLDVVASRNFNNPVLEWIGNIKWDGHSRLDELYDTLNITTTPEVHALNKALLRKWLIQAVACALKEDGVRGAGTLVFSGEEGRGKTGWFRRLVGGREHLFVEGVHLDPKVVDTVIEATSGWICELGELDGTFRKADMAALKAFLTKGRDTYRAAYDRKRAMHPRHTAFVGTVNDHEFLAEPGAHRRFWSIEITGDINFEHDVDMGQVWAEMRSYYEAGELWYLDDQELRQLAHRNQHHHVKKNPYDELLLMWFDWNNSQRVMLSATEVLEVVHGGRLPSNLRAAQTQMGQALMRAVTPGDIKKARVTKYRVPKPRTMPASGGDDGLF